MSVVGSLVTRASAFTRTSGDLLRNVAGMASGQPPLQWQWGETIDPGGPARWWTGYDAGAPIGPNGPWSRSGAGLPAVQRATNLIVEPLVSMPWEVMRGRELLPTPRWMLDPMLARPDDRIVAPAAPVMQRFTAIEFWSQLLVSVLWRGMGYFVWQPDVAGSPLAGTLRVLNPDDVQPRVVDTGVAWVIGDGESEVTVDADGGFTLGAVRYQVTTMRGQPPYDDYGRAAGILERGAADLRLGIRMRSYAEGTLSSGVPAGYLRSLGPGLTSAQAEELRNRWMAAHGGDRRSIAVLNATTEFHPIALSPVDVALIEMKKMAIVDVANLFGVDPSQLGGSISDSNTYANVESRMAHFLMTTLAGWSTRLEQCLSALLPTGQTMAVQFRGMLRADQETRYRTYAVGIDKGLLTVDEVRGMEGLPPLEDEGIG